MKNCLRGRTWLFLFLILLFLFLWLLLSRFVILISLQKEADNRIMAFQTRAATIALAAESLQRLAPQNATASLLELSRQPGIAWIVITNERGEIIQDSSPGVTGHRLYTAGEIARLSPESDLQGRFLPDDENIYETWQLFRPDRLHPAHSETGTRIIFIALNAAGLHQELAASRQRLWIISFAFCGLIAFSIALIFLARRYFFTRKRLVDAYAFSYHIIEKSPWAIFVLSQSGEIIFANVAARQCICEGCDNIRAISGPDWDSLLNLKGRDKKEIDTCIDMPDGGAESVNITITGLAGTATHESSYLLAIRQTGEMRRLEHKLAEARRMAELGRIAAGLAHEIRNPLGSICGYAAYLKQRVKDEWAIATAGLLAGEAARLNNVLGDFLQFTKRPSLQLAETPLEEPLKRVYAIALPDAVARNVELLEDFDNVNGHLARIDAQRLVQALLNLTLNAIQACSAGQKVILSANLLEAGSKLVPPTADRSLAWIQISVRDTGPGMDVGVLEQIFTPYFSTRPEGSGLGLPLARQLVEAHGGLLTVSSVPGNGSIFVIFIPQDGE